MSFRTWLLTAFHYIFTFLAYPNSMTPNSLQSHATAYIIAAGALFGLALPSAQADVTLQGQQTVGVGQAAPVTAAVRLFLQGANARLETAGEPTLVYDGKGNILYGLDTARKSYYMTVPVEEEPTDALPGGPGEAKEDVKLDLHETGQILTLAGQPAHQYTVSGTVTFTRDRPEGGGQRGGGGRRRRGGGGGGFPGQNGGGFPGGNGGGGRPPADFTPPQWSLSGEVWLADGVKFPSKENTSLAAQLAAASVGPFQQPLADELDKHHGLPLLARMTVTHTPASANGRQVNQYGGVGDSSAPRPVPTATVTTFTVRSVSDAPLDPRLFQAPLEYALVAAPLDPYAPGRFTPAP